MELVYNAVENVAQTGTWGATGDDILVSEATLVEWLREANSGTDLVSQAEVSAGMQTVTQTNELFCKRVMQLGLGMESIPEEKVVLTGNSVNVTSGDEQRVVDLLTGVEASELYDFVRPKLRYKVVKDVGESRGWGTSLANEQIEPVSTCPLTLPEAIKTLNVEELAVFFVLFPDKLKSWKSRVYDKHRQLVADYRARVQKHYADAKEAKKKHCSRCRFRGLGISC